MQTELREQAVARVQQRESGRAVPQALRIALRACEMVAAVPGVLRPGRWAAIGRDVFGRKHAGFLLGTDRARGRYRAAACGGACRSRPKGGISNRLDVRGEGLSFKRTHSGN